MNQPTPLLPVPYQLFMLVLCVLVFGWLAADAFLVLDDEVRQLLRWADFAPTGAAHV